MYKKLEKIHEIVKKTFSIEESFWISSMTEFKDYIRLELVTKTTLIRKPITLEKLQLTEEEFYELQKFMGKVSWFCFNFISQKLKISKAHEHHINFKEETFEVCVRSGEFRDFWLVFKYEDIGKDPKNDILAEVLKK